ncbi:probable ATP-dependent RNA helicase CG8611 [Trichoplusia ni]|uniref:ATP-dependent RNA helicase n=1 Tax=Trichoplusia ni TaxID=7111 RepID=A0A7E5VC45_TRINI|nr:probable ATP-dependent RNA helicase CG8611 [Trichoplusia ni]
MDDLQLNISVPKKDKKKASAPQQNAGEYKFVSNAKFTGKTIARKRPQNLAQANREVIKNAEGPPKKVAKFQPPTEEKSDDLGAKLRDLSENKGKYQGKNYQQLSDNIQLKQNKPRSGGWISSLFKNNPQVPRIGQRAVKPIVEKVFAGQTFSDLNIHPHTVANLQQNLGLKELMTVQQNAVPVLLQGRDVLIRSQTGSGKTLAYALPIIEGLQAIRPKISRHDGIRVIVVIPTRELAVQTYELFVKLVKPFHWIVPGLLSGGQKRKAEKARLRKGLSILVGTPGRINDHLRHTQSLNFAKTGCLVLDEADRLLDMGYEKDVAAIVKAIEDHKKAATYDPMALVKQNIVKKIPDEEEAKQETNESENDEKSDVKHHLTEVFLSKEKQTILLSATLTKAVENLAGITLVDPVFVDTSEGKAIIADSLKGKEDSENVISKPEVPVPVKVPEKPKAVKAEAKSSPEKKEIPVDAKRGLKAFTGFNHQELFKAENSTDNNDAKIETATNNAADDDSDSDSDYEYFKAQKKYELTHPKVEKKADDDDDDDDSDDDGDDDEQPSSSVNTFADALKSAIGEDELVLPATVNQSFIIVPMKLRLVTLCGLIVEHCVNNKKGGKMIIFMATLEMVDYHSDLIETVLTGKEVKVKKKGQEKGKNSKSGKRKGDDENDDDAQSSSSEDAEKFQVDYEEPSEGGLVPVDLEMFSLHGSMPHEQRMEVFKQFRAARCGVLICTDVAARGIDIPRVDLVLQYCAPASATDYVHRVGRTGRAAQVGAAVLFLLPSETHFIRHLEQKRIRLRQTDESRALEALRTVVPAAATAQRAAVAVQARLERTAHTNTNWLLRASRAYTSWVRFYSGYPRDVKEYLDAKQLHLGHAAKAFALRDAPATLARRVKSNPSNKEKPSNRLTIHKDEEKKRPGFEKAKFGSFGSRAAQRQSSMHTASEFDSGLSTLDQSQPKNKKKKNK